MSREALGETYPEGDTGARLLAPSHFVKVDHGILPVEDYLHIELFERSGVLILLNPYVGIQQGGMERHLSHK